MVITIIHGQGHKGSTFNITSMLKEKLYGGDTVVHEYFLPKDTPDYCFGCYQCIMKGEEYCPQTDKVQKIVVSMLESKIIIIDSPTYCFEMTGQLKTMFDHLSYMWLSHRPRNEMFNKIGIVISTTAGAGSKNVTKSIANQMFWWGVPKIYRMHFKVNASNWADVSGETKGDITKKIEEVSQDVKNNIHRTKPGIKTRFFFNIMRKMQQSNTWNMTDRYYWEERDWLKAARPWR